MIKQTSYENPKDYLIARDSDRLFFFTLEESRIRGAYVQANLVVNEMAKNHALGPYETFLLGQAFIAGLLMTSNLKDDDQINLRLNTDGPAKGFSVDANARGEVRGYLFQNPIYVPQGTNQLSFSQAMGNGLLSVSRTLQKSHVPTTGTVEYQAGSLADSLVHYFDQSEQTPTAVDISLHFDRNGHCLGAAGLLLQSMPGCSQEQWNLAAQRLNQIPSIGENAASSHDPSALLQFWFSEMNPQLHNSRRVEFFCPCSKQRFEVFLKGLSKEDQNEILTNGPFPLETTCHNCSSTYDFSREQLLSLWEK